MAKKKSRKIIVKPPKPKVPTIFDCPFCGNKKCITVKLNRKSNVAELKCKSCSTNYNNSINNLTEPVDVFYAWLEECKKVNSEELKKEEKEEEESKPGEEFF